MTADPNSRYAGCEVATFGPPGPDQVRYRRRRFLPTADSAPRLAEHAVTRGDRIDLIAATYYGDPLQYWRICDANLVIHPSVLTADQRIGGRVVVPLPGF